MIKLYLLMLAPHLLFAAYLKLYIPELKDGDISYDEEPLTFLQETIMNHFKVVSDNWKPLNQEERRIFRNKLQICLDTTASYGEMKPDLASYIKNAHPKFSDKEIDREVGQYIAWSSRLFRQIDSAVDKKMLKNAFDRIINDEYLSASKAEQERMIKKWVKDEPKRTLIIISVADNEGNGKGPTFKAKVLHGPRGGESIDLRNIRIQFRNKSTSLHVYVTVVAWFVVYLN